MEEKGEKSEYLEWENNLHMEEHTSEVITRWGISGQGVEEGEEGRKGGSERAENMER